jgi:hypothetical protein
MKKLNENDERHLHDLIQSFKLGSDECACESLKWLADCMASIPKEGWKTVASVMCGEIPVGVPGVFGRDRVLGHQGNIQLVVREEAVKWFSQKLIFEKLDNATTFDELVVQILAFRNPERTSKCRYYAQLFVYDAALRYAFWKIAQQNPRATWPYRNALLPMNVVYIQSGVETGFRALWALPKNKKHVIRKESVQGMDFDIRRIPVELLKGIFNNPPELIGYEWESFLCVMSGAIMALGESK